MSVTTMLPKQGGECYGVWIGRGKGDVHIYAMGGLGAVIGTNKNYKDKIEFSDMALCMAENGALTFQYANDAGQPVYATLTPDDVSSAMMHMLNTLKAKAKQPVE